MRKTIFKRFRRDTSGAAMSEVVLAVTFTTAIGAIVGISTVYGSKAPLIEEVQADKPASDAFISYRD